jgi:hypothetical protein
MPALGADGLYTLATADGNSEEFNDALAQLRDATPVTTQRYEAQSPAGGEAIGDNSGWSSMYPTPQIINSGVNADGLAYDVYDSGATATAVRQSDIESFELPPPDGQTAAATSQNQRPWYERMADESGRVAGKTLAEWRQHLNTVWQALPGTSDEATTEAARTKISQGVLDTIKGLSTLIGEYSPEMEAAYRYGDADTVALVDEAQQRQREAWIAIYGSLKKAVDEANDRSGVAGASAMVVTALGMELIGGEGTGAVLKAAERVAEIVKVAKTPMEAATLLNNELAAARQAGSSAEEIALLEKAQAQARREAEAVGGATNDAGRLEAPATGATEGVATTVTERYSGDLIQVNKPDAAADALANRIGGQSRVRFANDAANREFDAVSDRYIAQSKPALQQLGSSVRDQMKATFEAAQETGKDVYYHFEGQPAQSVIDKLNEYSGRYGIKVIIDTNPLMR